MNSISARFSRKTAITSATRGQLHYGAGKSGFRFHHAHGVLRAVSRSYYTVAIIFVVSGFDNDYIIHSRQASSRIKRIFFRAMTLGTLDRKVSDLVPCLLRPHCIGLSPRPTMQRIRMLAPDGYEWRHGL
jgi:hypothetical protein